MPNQPACNARHLSKLLLTILLELLLAACGGGDADDETVATTQPVDCKARPELCR